MKTKILFSALFAVCRMCDVATPAEEGPAPSDRLPASTTASCSPQPAEAAKARPPCAAATAPDRTFRVRVRDNMLTLGLGDDDNELSIACREFTLQFDGEEDEHFQVECCGGVRIGWSESWADLPACLISADRLRFNSADATALLTSDGEAPCRLEFILPRSGKPSKIVADEIRVQLREGLVEARGTMSVFLPKEDDD